MTGGFCAGTASAAPPSAQQVLANYGDMAQAMYGDSLATAKTLQQLVDAFLADPTPATLAAVRKAWVSARAWLWRWAGCCRSPTCAARL